MASKKKKKVHRPCTSICGPENPTRGQIGRIRDPEFLHPLFRLFNKHFPVSALACGLHSNCWEPCIILGRLAFHFFFFKKKKSFFFFGKGIQIPCQLVFLAIKSGNFHHIVGWVSHRHWQSKVHNSKMTCNSRIYQ